MTGEESVRSAPESGRRGWWRRRHDDDDDGPFLPPEPAPGPQAGPRPRPQPRPQPRPRPRPIAAAVPAAAATVAAPAEPAREQPRADPPAAAKDTESGTQPKSRRRTLRSSRGLRFVTKLVVALVIAAVAALVLRTYVVAPYFIPSASMEPTLKGGGGDTDDRILVDKVTYRIHDPHEGDIVVFNRPDTWQVSDTTLVKRIIGLPGDIVTLRNGLVYVNGLRLDEGYVNKACGSAPTKPLVAGKSQWRVPMDEYFVMGDNRCNSDDSRHFGPVPKSKIVGRVFVIVWPLSRFGTP